MLKSTRCSKKKTISIFFLINFKNELSINLIIGRFVHSTAMNWSCFVGYNQFLVSTRMVFPIWAHFFVHSFIFFFFRLFFRSSVFPLVTSRYSLEIALADNVFIESILISIYFVKSIHVICYARPKKRSNNKGASMCVTATMEQLVISEFVY